MPNPSVHELVTAASGREPKCGRTRVVLIDGPAGSGKSTLANRLAVALGGAPSLGAGTFRPDAPLSSSAPVQIVHGDDLYEGWGGLATLAHVLLDEVLEPLARGGAGEFRMWDWVEGRRTHLIRVPQRDWLIVEGVGVALPRSRELAVLTVWVEAPWETRLARGLARDGDSYDVAERWRVFDADERALHERSGTRAAADAAIDGTSPIPDE